MVRWERYIQHGERVGEVQRRKEHGSVVGWAKEATGKGLGREARSDLEGCLVTKDRHTIILCQSWGVDVRVGVISRCKLDKQIDK
jgi:hypothetical protein